MAIRIRKLLDRSPSYLWVRAHLPNAVIEYWRALRSLFRRRDFHRKFLQARRKGKQIVHYLHIGKTGGTALKAALKDHLSSRSLEIVLHGHRIRLRDIPPKDKVIVFLRDPIARFVSGFCSRKREGKPRYNYPWSPGEKVAFEMFSTPNQLALGISSEEEGTRNAARKAMNKIFHLRDSYWYWFENEKYFLSRKEDILLLGFQETLSEDFEELKSKLGIPIEVQLPKDSISSHRTPAGTQVGLDAKAEENLRIWYRRDFELIELCKLEFRGSGRN